jgi:prepilin signal peptidase PulO-like enzyme (type II secretory pathway)
MVLAHNTLPLPIVGVFKVPKDMYNKLMGELLLFILGTFFGSFFNLVSDRVVTGESILYGRSRCDSCKKSLGAKNLLPVLSFLFQRGKSSCCKTPLSLYYPLSELMTGLAFAFAGKFSHIFTQGHIINYLLFVYIVVVLSFYIILFLTDAKYKIIPDSVVYSAIGVALLLLIVMSIVDLKMFRDQLLADDFGKYLIEAGFWHQRVIATVKQLLILLTSSIFISLFFISLILVTKGRGMGGGDVKLGFLIGIFNGFPNNVLAIFLGFLSGALYSLILIMLKRKKLKDVIAFGPFLIFGSLVAFVWGDFLIKWYFGLL